MKRHQSNDKPFYHEAIAHEETKLLSSVDQTIAASKNSANIGSTGEREVVKFLNKYLPSCFRCVSGHFLMPSGQRSPQIDVMVLDARYPLLSQNADGSALAMFHSIIATVEIKTMLGKREIASVWSTTSKIRAMEQQRIPVTGSPMRLYQVCLAYRCSVKMETLQKHFFARPPIDKPFVFLWLLRLKENDQKESGSLGAALWFEGNKVPWTLTTISPLSDFYYDLNQQALYEIGSRKLDFNDIGGHLMEYFHWGTAHTYLRDQTKK